MLRQAGWILANLVLLNIAFLAMLALFTAWFRLVSPRLERRRARRLAIKRLIAGAIPARPRPDFSARDADLIRRRVQIVGRSSALRTRLSGSHWPLSA
jgi:hypothetical protein